MAAALASQVGVWGVWGALRRAIVGWQNIKLPTFELVFTPDFWLPSAASLPETYSSIAPENGGLEHVYI